MNYFEVKVKYERPGEEGRQQKVAETYLTDTLTFADSEERVIEEIKPYLQGEMEVVNIKKVRLAEVIDCEEGDKWYKSKVVIVTFDEEHVKEKRTANQILVKGSDINDALERLTKELAGWQTETEIQAITETPIMDVLRHEAK